MNELRVALMRPVIVCALAIGMSAHPIHAEPLGLAFGISNDSIGEFRDRWQSSSVQVGALWGQLPDGELPNRLGVLNEFRFRSDIITPERLDVIVSSDRRHAGVLAFGLHSYAVRGAWDVRVGADLVVVGPQTGLYVLQQELHRVLGFTVPELDGFQIENAVRIDLSGEIARPIETSFGTLRPFAEAQFGTEDFLRIGADLTFGVDTRLAMRTVTTGERLPFVRPQPGWTARIGADVAWVEESIYLPEHLGYTLTDVRVRVRGGLGYAHDMFDVFYGLAYLSEEFEAQHEGQFVGTLQLRFRF